MAHVVLAGGAGGGGAAALQTSYDGGNTIVATAARPIAFSNAVDATDLLTLTRTFAGAGDALFIDMGPGGEAVTAPAIDIDMGSGSSGPAFDIAADGSGPGGTIAVAAANAANGIDVTLAGGGGAGATVTHTGADNGFQVLDGTNTTNLDANNLTSSGGSFTILASGGGNDLVLDAGADIDVGTDMVPDADDTHDLGRGQTLRWAEVRSRLVVGVGDSGTVTLGAGIGGGVFGRSGGAGTTNLQFGGAPYDPVLLAGNLTAGGAASTCRMLHYSGGGVMFGSAFTGGAVTGIAEIVSYGSAYGNLTGGYAFTSSGSGTSRVYNAGSGSFLWAYISKSGTGTSLATTAGYGAFAQGRIQGAGTHTMRSSGTGSFAQGYLGGAGGTSSLLEATSAGAFAQGHSINGASLRATGIGSFAQGSIAGAGTLLASGNGSFAHGRINTTGTIQATVQGAFAAGFATSGTIEATAAGAFAMGDANSNTIQATASGAFAMGYADGADVIASGVGAMSNGDAASYAITASGAGSLATGMADTGPITAGPADNTFQFGPGANTLADSFQIGGDGSNAGFRALLTGQHGSPMSTLTLGAAATTFAADSNVMEITGDAGSNTIATITGGLAGQLLTLLFVDALVTVTDDNSHAADTVDLSAAFTSADDTVLQLMFSGTSWYEVSRSVN